MDGLVQELLSTHTNLATQEISAVPDTDVEEAESKLVVVGATRSR